MCIRSHTFTDAYASMGASPCSANGGGEDRRSQDPGCDAHVCRSDGAQSRCWHTKSRTAPLFPPEPRALKGRHRAIAGGGSLARRDLADGKIIQEQIFVELRLATKSESVDQVRF